MDEQTFHLEEDAFWTMIQEAKQGSNGDGDKELDLLRASLIPQSTEHILDFYELQHKFVFHLVGLDDFYEAAKERYWFSSDGFEYFCCWCVGQGKEFFDQIVANPAVLETIKLPEMRPELEGLAYVASEAWQKKTGEDTFWEAIESWGYKTRNQED